MLSSLLRSSARIVHSLPQRCWCSARDVPRADVERSSVGGQAGRAKATQRLNGDASRQALQLSPGERRLFDIISSAFSGVATARVAGGWVRDKLLFPLERSNDIDIALDALSGSAGVEVLGKYCTARNVECGKVVLKSHGRAGLLEASKIRVEGYDLDVLQLRSESYSEASRIPRTELGTPEGDALRRDLTINSLFYNIDSQEVEDFTGMGVRDLRDGVIRTPRDPHRTFDDDPLRMMRAVRFAARFGFSYADGLLDAMLSPASHSSFLRKVDLSRIGDELRLILCRGEVCVAPLRVLGDSGLLQLIIGRGQSDPSVDAWDWQLALRLVSVAQDWFIAERPQPASSAWTVPLLCLLYPLVAPLSRDAVKSSVKRILQHSLPVRADVGRHLEFLAHAACRVLGDITSTAVGLKEEELRAPEAWERMVGTVDGVDLALLLREGYLQHEARMSEALPIVVVGMLRDRGMYYDEQVLRAAVLAFAKRIVGACEIAPGLDGADIMAMFGLSPGRAVGVLKRELLVHSIRHPNASREERTVHLGRCMREMAECEDARPIVVPSKSEG